MSPVPQSQVDLEAPISRPSRNMFCVGKTYNVHAAEFAASRFDSSRAAGVVPRHPIIFSKPPGSVISHHAPVRIDPAVSTAIDYEAALVVIIATGTPARGGIGHTPPVCLKEGAVVRTEVDGVGTLENRFEERA